MRFFVLTVVLLFCDRGFGAKFPASYKRCKVSPELDGKPNDCLTAAVHEAIRDLADGGNSDLGASTLDPLLINSILIEKGETSPVAVKLEFKDVHLMGLSNIDVKSVRGKLSSPKDFEFIMDVILNELRLEGPYKVSGKVLILPIQGDGTSNLTMKNVAANINIKGEPQMRNGKEYLKIKGFKLSLSTTRLYVDLENLFNGDKALGDNMNKFLNDNWEEIFLELKSAVEATFSAVFEEYSRRILEKIQFSNIFLVD